MFNNDYNEYTRRIIDKVDKEANISTLRDYLQSSLFVELSERIRLSNGKLTQYYFDIRKYACSGYFNTLIGYAYTDIMNELSKRLGNEFPTIKIGGLETGAIPIIVSICRHNNMGGFYVKKEPKKYGMKNSIEGDMTNTDYVMLVDDVITTGKSVLKCIDVIKKHNPKITIVGVYPIIDRNKEIENYDLFFQLKSKNIEYVPIFSSLDFINNYKEYNNKILNNNKDGIKL